MWSGLGTVEWTGDYRDVEWDVEWTGDCRIDWGL